MGSEMCIRDRVMRSIDRRRTSTLPASGGVSSRWFCPPCKQCQREQAGQDDIRTWPVPRGRVAQNEAQHKERWTDLQKAEPAFICPPIGCHPRRDLIHGRIGDSPHVIVSCAAKPPSSLEHSWISGYGDSGWAFGVSGRVVSVEDHLRQRVDLFTQLGIPQGMPKSRK